MAAAPDFRPQAPSIGLYFVDVIINNISLRDTA